MGRSLKSTIGSATVTNLRQYRLALQIFQSSRLRRDYRDLAEIEQYKQVGEFFFTEIYGPRDFSERDNGARRLQQFLHLVPGVVAEDVEQVLELLELTNQLDTQLAQLLIDGGAPLHFSEEEYETAYRQQENYDERLTQLNLIDQSLRNVFRLSHIGLLGAALRRTKLVARLAGIEAIHQFLLRGYEALRVVTDIEQFARTIYERELERLDRIYERNE
jgi:hypothetical protein